jgi:CMP-N,N'-diacetyllegionaminic acid synthase
MRVLALIPARGGSVTLPRKNVLPFCGRPLIAYSIDAARKAAEAGAPIDRIVVSTEDAEIAEISRKCGAEVPFMRPAELARADTPSLPVVQHALESLERANGSGSWDWVLLLQPTSPLRSGSDIVRSLALTQQPGTTAVVSVTSANNAHPAKLKLIVDGVLKPYLGDALTSQRRQDFGFDVFKTNGAIYLTRRDVLLEQDSFFGDCPRPLVMPPERSLDIDTKLDFEISEILYQRLQAPELQDTVPCTARAK